MRTRRRPFVAKFYFSLAVVWLATSALAEETTDAFTPRPPANGLEVQIALAQRGFSAGAIDGIVGLQTVGALKAFQESQNLPVTGEIDDATGERLMLTSPPLVETRLTAADFIGLQALSPTWLGKSTQPALEHETILERIAERTHASPAMVRRLNPGVNWTQAQPDTVAVLPAVGRVALATLAARLHVRLSDHTLEVRDAMDRLVAHFPASIARKMEKRPLGELRVTVVIPNPDYTFDPEVFPESEEGQQLGRKLVLPPGPNNPVGVAWIGLDRPGYGIHGTPNPEQVGRTESHGCFRLANWDAETLLQLAWVGLPVVVDP